MLLRNYYNQLYSLFSGQTIINGLKQPDGTLFNCVCPGSTDAGYFVSVFRSLSGASPSYQNVNLVFGRGNTPASIDDYKLESIITTSVNASGFSKSIDNDGNFVIVASIRNEGKNQVVINEVGVAFNCFYSSSARVTCLVERTVLDEPITLGVGESGFLTYKLKFSPIVGAFT